MKIFNSKFYVVSEPEISWTDGDATPYLKNLRISENYGYYDKNNKWVAKGSAFFSLKIFGDLAEDLYGVLEKGCLILIPEGIFEVETYKDKKNPEQEKTNNVITTKSIHIISKAKQKTDE